jgi:hypothetical protein
VRWLRVSLSTFFEGRRPLVEFLVAWVISAILVGWFWRRCGLNFGCGLACSLLFSPLVFLVPVFLKHVMQGLELQE